LYKVEELQQEMWRQTVEADGKMLMQFNDKAETWDFNRESRKNISVQDYSCRKVQALAKYSHLSVQYHRTSQDVIT